MQYFTKYVLFISDTTADLPRIQYSHYQQCCYMKSRFEYRMRDMHFLYNRKLADNTFKVLVGCSSPSWPTVFFCMYLQEFPTQLSDNCQFLFNIFMTCSGYHNIWCLPKLGLWTPSITYHSNPSSKQERNMVSWMHENIWNKAWKC